MNTGSLSATRCRPFPVVPSSQRANGETDPDLTEWLGVAGEGPILGLEVQIAEAKWQAHCIESQQLCAVHSRRKIGPQRCVITPKTIEKSGPIIKSRPGEGLRAAMSPLKVRLTHTQSNGLSALQALHVLSTTRTGSLGIKAVKALIFGHDSDSI